MRGIKKLIAIFLVGLLAGQQPAQASSSEAFLLSKIKQQTDQAISKKYFADFDGDGEKELFAVTGGKNGPNQIWFAGSQAVKRVYHKGLAVYSWSEGICTLNSGQKLLVMETGAFGSGSVSVCYYVQGGRVYTVKHAGEGLTHLSGDDFAVFPSAFDWNCTEDGVWSGHTYKKYYLKWTGSKFVEYEGRKISIGRLKKYKGVNKHLKQVKKLGYKVTSAYYRKNGIINVNVKMKRPKGGGGTDYDNITFTVKGNKASLVIHDKKGKDILEKSGYGGIYKARGF